MYHFVGGYNRKQKMNFITPLGETARSAGGVFISKL